MRASWDANDRAKAIADSLDAIGTVETLRSLQDDSDSSAEQFSTWTSDYYWLSGRLLRDGRESERDLAFTIVERMRARSLLDMLERSRGGRPADGSASKERRALLESIAAVQRRLMDPALAADERRAKLAELQDLELREREARRAARPLPVRRRRDADRGAAHDSGGARRTRSAAVLPDRPLGHVRRRLRRRRVAAGHHAHAALGPSAARSEGADADRADADRADRSRRRARRGPRGAALRSPARRCAAAAAAARSIGSSSSPTVRCIICRSTCCGAARGGPALARTLRDRRRAFGDDLAVLAQPSGACLHRARVDAGRPRARSARGRRRLDAQRHARARPSPRPPAVRAARRTGDRAIPGIGRHARRARRPPRRR